MAGQFELSRSCPGSKGLSLAVMRSWGPGDGAVLCLEPQPCNSIPTPTVVSSYSFSCHATFSTASEQAPGHGEWAVLTLEGAGEPPPRLHQDPPQYWPTAEDPLRDFGKIVSCLSLSTERENVFRGRAAKSELGQPGPLPSQSPKCTCSRKPTGRDIGWGKGNTSHLSPASPPAHPTHSDSHPTETVEKEGSPPD